MQNEFGLEMNKLSKIVVANYRVYLLLACQPVEKVGVGPVGSPRERENKPTTLRIRRIRSPNRGTRELEGVFQQAVELENLFQNPMHGPTALQVLRAFVERLTDAVCHAA
jgi:hypothetical protein